MERQFLERGMNRSDSSRAAEVVVLNTCTVTAEADKDARAAIRRVRRENPTGHILVTGCYAQRAPEEIAALPGVTWVVGNSHKHQVAEIAAPSAAGFIPLTQLSGDQRSQVLVADIFAHTELLAAPVFGAPNQRTRPNLKVQDGCDNRCSFCVIPAVRGHSRSMPTNRVLEEVRLLVCAGYREVVISGINLGRWGRDLESNAQVPAASSRAAKRPRVTADGSRLEGLVRTILEETSVEKLRISSVEPMDWSHELIQLMATSPRIAKHAHVPLQSGSDAVLRRMHRKYRPWHYREKIRKIHNAMPGAAIGADVMVGFPGETEAEFEETRRMAEELPFTYLHVFIYSARPGTPAAERSDQVPSAVAHARSRVLREIGARKQREFQRSLVGTKIAAITLQSGDGEFTEALTDNYLKMRVRGHFAPSHWIGVEIEGIEEGILSGRPVGGTEVTNRAARNPNIVDLQILAG